jgi:hypothetical protein
VKIQASTPCGERVRALTLGGGADDVMLFTETLTVTITGGGRYTVHGSNDFEGAVPEPSALTLFATVLLALVALARVRRRAA